MAKHRYRLGIDLGGTKIHAVVVDSHDEVVGSHRLPTRGELGYRKVLQRIAECAEEAMDDAGVKTRHVSAAGLGVPGPVDARRGRILMCANLGWSPPVPIGPDLAKLLGLPVALGNDANFGALAEASLGSARGCNPVFAAFVGTGLGAGLVKGGRVLNGAHGYAGEFGHVSAPFGEAPCGCGRRGCLETVASRRGIIRLLREVSARGERRLIKCSGKLRSSALRDAYQQGCPATRKAIGICADALAWGLATAGMILDPQVFVLGGGVMEALGKQMLPRIASRMAALSSLYALHPPDLRLAELGDDAVAVGAAVAAGDL